MFKSFVIVLIKYIVLLFFVVISIGPILWVILGSFKTHKELFGNSAFSIPKQFSFSNYEKAMSIAPVGKFFTNSLLICGISTLLSVIIVSCCAYVVARFDFKFKGLLVLLISSVLLISAQSISQPIFVLFKTFNLFDTKTGLILVYLAFSIPVTFYIMRSYFLSIPKSLDESAYIDGAGFLKTYLQIILPLARPGAATAAILQFIGSWNEFYFALILTSGNNARTVP
ncbi:carbohydrate ABC transporter permease, partial [Paenibacillus sp. N3.4]|uniref:carbohydrate ABC transporter permease n=1 Tax=Paenibacillus sp. N3.4 TaxID=2603222 RepID=UPI0011C7F7A3